MRKILVSLLVVSMLLGLVGTASAAAFSDTAGNEYIDKVAGYDWMVGDAGATTFRPTDNITRAEAAKVIVAALGLNAAAEAAAGLGTKFTDVLATDWFSGYVNVCTSKNIIKGCGDGTFQPLAKVTNAEMITMIIRAMNRESLAVGDWPIGHITAAVDAGIIGSGFSASIPATRENVATYVAKAASVTHYVLTTDGWVEDEDDKCFESLCGIDAKATSTLESFDSDSITTAAATYDLASTFRVEGGKALKDLIGYKVVVTLNEDKDAILVTPDSDYSIKTGKIDYKLGDDYLYLKSDTTKYEVAAGAALDVYLNGVVVDHDLSQVTGDVELHIIDDVVTTIKMTDYQVEDVQVGSVYTSGSAGTWSLTAGNVTYSLADDAILMKNGVEVELTDIKADDIVNIATGAASAIKYLDATDKTIAGKVTAVRTMDNADGTFYYVTVDGVEYETSEDTEIAVNSVIEALLTVSGDIFSVDVTSATSLYGKVVSFSTGTGSYDKWVVNIKGVDTTYEVAEDPETDESLHEDLTGAGIAISDYVKLDINNAGRIDADTAEVTEFETPAEGGSYFKVAKVYGSDKLAKISEIYGDNEADPTTNRDAAVSTFYSVPDTAVVYTNGSYTGAGVSAVPEGGYVQFVVDSGKVVFMLVDNSTKYVSGKVSNEGDVISGLTGAVTGGTDAGNRAKIYAYATADMTGDPMAIGAVNKDGDFAIYFPGINAAEGEVAYLKVVEKYGNFTTFTATRAEDGTALALTDLVSAEVEDELDFDEDVYEYELEATVDELDIDLTATIAGAKIYWNVDTDDVDTETEVDSEETFTVDLEDDENVITIHVETTLGRGVDYTITVTKADE